MAIQQRVNDRFKVFVVGSAEAFTSDRAVSAKGIGVEYLEGEGRLVLSLGYCDDAEGYAAKLLSRAAGTLDLDRSDSLATLESTLS